MASSLRIEPASPLSGEPVTCAGSSSDPDGDPTSLSFRWLVDGREVGTGPSGAFALSPGQGLACEATADDGLERGAPARVVTSAGAVPGGLNVLIVLLDDLGVENVPSFGVGVGPQPHVPTLERLGDEGVRFRRTWSHPTCSATRASLLTGRHVQQHGVGSQVQYGVPGWELDGAELTLAEALRGAPTPYASSAVGKWHLGNEDGGGPTHALDVGGFDWFEGTDDNLSEVGTDGLRVDYFDWEKNTNGAYERVGDYATTHVVDAALRRVDEMPEPWLLYVALHAPHGPFHVPPEGLYTTDPGGDGWQGKEQFRAMVEAVDAELARLLDALPLDVLARTLVIVLSDNGSYKPMGLPPFGVQGRSKGSVYEGGTRVPMVMWGAPVSAPGRVVDDLVHVQDVFATVLEVAGVAPDPALAATHASFSLLDHLTWRTPPPPARAWVTATNHEPLGFQGPYTLYDVMVREPVFKLITFTNGREELYRIGDAPAEGDELLAAGPLTADAEAALQRLRTIRDRDLAVP